MWIWLDSLSILILAGAMITGGFALLAALFGFSYYWKQGAFLVAMYVAAAIVTNTEFEWLRLLFALAICLAIFERIIPEDRRRVKRI